MNAASSTDLAEGERRREDQLSLLRDRRAVFVRRGQRALLQRLLEVDQATADDVRGVVELPPDVDPVCLGAVPTPLARAGIIERVGYVQTVRPDAHARPVSLWRLRDRDAAVRWLAAHPELDDHGGLPQPAPRSPHQRELF